jgi:8-oxo-dGTP pyrophosphatase MutT (NUDIX family)
MLEVAHAILLVNNHYALQLRDNKPTIAVPGQWSLFGGGLEKGEDPLVGIAREIKEELCLSPTNFNFLWDYRRLHETGTMAHYCFFEADVTRLWEQHKLMEGQATQYFCFNDLKSLDIPPFIQEILQRHHAERMS